MRALQVALDALGAQHAPVERELLPRLEADNLVVPDLELHAALLAAETAMRLDKPIGLRARRQPHPGHRRRVRAEAIDDAEFVNRKRRHESALSPPGLALRESEQRPAAPRADALIVLRALRRIHLVGKSELLFHVDE